MSANVNAYLILRKEENLLFHLRKNTGYCDAMYGLISGHVEEGESATQAIIRETLEEAALIIKPSDLKFFHMMHRKTNRLNIDIFFECFSYQGEIKNREPHKCAALEFHPIDQLSSKIIPYIREVLRPLSQLRVYSESGWSHD